MESLLLLVKDLAPTVAALLNGPMGNEIIKLLAGMLGSVSSPVAVAKALDDPNAVQKLKALETALAAHVADDTIEQRSIDLVGTAYLKELDKGAYYSMLRPTAGWLMIAANAAFIVIVLRSAWFGNYLPMDHIVQYLGVMSPLAAVTGVYFWGRTVDKQTMLATPTPVTVKKK